MTCSVVLDQACSNNHRERADAMQPAACPLARQHRTPPATLRRPSRWGRCCPRRPCLSRSGPAAPGVGRLHELGAFRSAVCTPSIPTDSQRTARQQELCNTSMASTSRNLSPSAAVNP